MTPHPTSETTDITLFVRTSGEEIARWNRQRIVDALMRETDIDRETAEAVSREVEKQIVASGIAVLTASLIRELVDAKLIERGLEQARRMHARLGFPLYDVRQLIFHENKENANIPHGPEGTNLLLAEGVKREYALHEVFSQEVGTAHAAGDIHLHGLGAVDRPYSACLTLEHLKKAGLFLPHSLNAAKPAKHPEVLLAHMVRFSTLLQGHFAAMVAWDGINLSFAPYLSGMSDREIRQFAQMLVYEFSQLTAGRGGQAMFTDIHLYWDIPPHFRELKVIGPGGKDSGEGYADYLADARRFISALLEVFLKGDATGRPFVFPRPLIHLSDGLFEDPQGQELLMLASAAAVKKGNPSFVFDRGGRPALFGPGYAGIVSGAGRAAAKADRSFLLHNVTLNLPRLGYLAGGDDERLFRLLTDRIDLAALAHLQKKRYLEGLIDLGEEGPLATLVMAVDGEPLLDLARSVSLVGMVGLNELAMLHRGKQLHESVEARNFGLAVVRRLASAAAEAGARLGIPILSGQTHAESTSYRFARLDLKYHSPRAGHTVRGNLAHGELYYTNSTHLPISAPLDPLERARLEGAYHPHLPVFPITQIWLGDEEPSADGVVRFLERIFRETTCSSVSLSPEFTSCLDCHFADQGLRDRCRQCGSVRVEQIAQITQYFSRVSAWNRGKRAELRDRYRGFPSNL
jgi:ribonucleoside-triphosphate reductase (formate)